MKRNSSKRQQTKASHFFLLFAGVVALVVILVTIFDFNQIGKSTRSISNQETLEAIRTKSRDVYNKCKGQQASCYEELSRKELLDYYSTPQILSALYDFDTYFSCHAFTHFVGRALYKKTKSIADSYSQIDFTCHGGAYHGVIEAYLDEKKLNLGDVTGDELRTICLDSRTKTDKNPSQVYAECLHGFGHAFMFITDSDLPLSLVYCDHFGLVKDREPCYGGAFMENSTSSTNPDHPPKWIKEDDKFYPCTILAEKYQNQCYFYQANYLIKTSVHNYNKVFADCEELNRSHRTNCLLGLGANLAGFSRKAGTSGAAQICSLGKNDAASLCIEGAVPSFMARYGGETSKLIEFCNRVADSLKELCFVKLGNVARSWYQNEEVKTHN